MSGLGVMGPRMADNLMGRSIHCKVGAGKLWPWYWSFSKLTFSLADRCDALSANGMASARARSQCLGDRARGDAVPDRQVRR